MFDPGCLTALAPDATGRLPASFVLFGVWIHPDLVLISVYLGSYDFTGWPVPLAPHLFVAIKLNLFCVSIEPCLMKESDAKASKQVTQHMHSSSRRKNDAMLHISNPLLFFPPRFASYYNTSALARPSCPSKLSFLSLAPSRDLFSLFHAVPPDNKFSSFVRQLNFYGFRKVKSNITVEGHDSKWWEFKVRYPRVCPVAPPLR